MKLVSFQQLCEARGPVIFCELGMGGLYRRGDVVYQTLPGGGRGEAIDFFQTAIVPSELALSMPKRPADAVGATERWGAADYKSEFIVFEDYELGKMVSMLRVYDGAAA